MKTKDRQRSSQSDDTRQRGANKVYSSRGPLAFILLFIISLSLTYALIQPEAHTGLVGSLVSKAPLFNNFLTFSLALTVLSLLAIMCFPPLEVYSVNEPQPLPPSLPKNDFSDNTEHSSSHPIQPVVSSASVNVPLQHIRKIPLHISANKDFSR